MEITMDSFHAGGNRRIGATHYNPYISL